MAGDPLPYGSTWHSGPSPIYQPPSPRTMMVNMPLPAFGLTIATLDSDGNVTIKVDQPSPQQIEPTALRRGHRMAKKLVGPQRDVIVALFAGCNLTRDYGPFSGERFHQNGSRIAAATVAALHHKKLIERGKPLKTGTTMSKTPYVLTDLGRVEAMR